MFNNGKITSKTIIHYINSFLIVLIFILSITSFFFLKSFSFNPTADIFMILISLLYLIFSIVIAIPGIFFPEKPTLLSAKTRRNIFLFQLVAFLLETNKMHGLAALSESKSLKSIKRSWNGPAVFILGIFLMFAEFFTALIISDSETLDINYILTTFASITYGKILIALFIGWVLLFLTTSIWFYIDTKENIPITDNMKSPKQETSNNTKLMAKCCNCGSIFNYSKHDGMCPECGKYNPLSADPLYLENSYKRKKTILVLIKTYGIIIGAFCFILIGSIIKYQIDYGNGLHGLKVHIPSLKHQEETPKTPEESDSPAFTAEEINGLLDDIRLDTGFINLYHKEQYKYNQTDTSGEKYDEVIILIATDNSEKVYWYQYFKYLNCSEKHKPGGIVFNMGMESNTLTKSDIKTE
ncbi:hypothetical protein Ana3638_08175 [Anaerocolumna sedimenticola]|uniref:Uncharacterized protein n=1 Tax=Anaerocolumna sedimenticola TaxID=2696063 RepID=A0A6P1TL57_9FIRM|nr:hypothetical protein [Anaerocolumna sedimenticola]QHQ60751.1 hypothetical protein Ana3638_08175 [Anaerocolumna sedimenticola]